MINKNKSEIIILSAKTEERLKAYAQHIYEFLGKCKTEKTTGEDKPSCHGLSVENIAYTLQVGREAMEERLAMIVKSKDQLIEKLDGYLQGTDEQEDIFHGNFQK